MQDKTTEGLGETSPVPSHTEKNEKTRETSNKANKTRASTPEDDIHTEPGKTKSDHDDRSSPPKLPPKPAKCRLMAGTISTMNKEKAKRESNNTDNSEKLLNGGSKKTTTHGSPQKLKKRKSTKSKKGVSKPERTSSPLPERTEPDGCSSHTSPLPLPVPMPLPLYTSTPLPPDNRASNDRTGSRDSRLAVTGERVDSKCDLEGQRSDMSVSSLGSVHSADLQFYHDSEAIEELLETADEAEIWLEFENLEKMHRRFDNAIRKHDEDLKVQDRTMDELMSEMEKTADVLAEFTGYAANTTADHKKFSDEMTRQRVQHKTNMLSNAMYEGENGEAHEDILALQRTVLDIRERSAVASEQEMKERNARMSEELEKELAFNKNLMNDLQDAERRCNSMESQGDCADRPRTGKKVKWIETESRYQENNGEGARSPKKDEGIVTGRPPRPPRSAKKTGRDTASARKQSERRDVKPPHQYDVTGSIGGSSSARDDLMLPPLIHKKQPPNEPRNVSPLAPALSPLSARSKKGCQSPISSRKMTPEVTHSARTPLPDIKRREESQSPRKTKGEPSDDSTFVPPAAKREKKAAPQVTSPEMEKQIVNVRRGGIRLDFF